MLKPLDSEKLATLLIDDQFVGCGRVTGAKRYLGEDKDLVNGVFSLLEIHSATFNAGIRYTGVDIKIVSIGFRDSPFRSLRLVPGSETTIDIYAFGEHVESFEMLGCPHNWVNMLKWLWNYGYQRQVAKAKKGYILPLLDLELYCAVANPEDDAGSPLIRQAHFHFANKDIAEAVYMLLLAFQLCSPQLHREAKNLESWHISFKEFPLRTLRIQPDTDRTRIAIHSREKRVPTLPLIDFPRRDPMLSDLECRQRMIEWIWDYGNKCIEARLKYKAQQSKIKPKPKIKRTEKSSLHKVLHPAGFKTQHVKSSKAKTVRPNLPPYERSPSLISSEAEAREETTGTRRDDYSQGLPNFDRLSI